MPPHCPSCIRKRQGYSLHSQNTADNSLQLAVWRRKFAAAENVQYSSTCMACRTKQAQNAQHSRNIVHTQLEHTALCMQLRSTTMQLCCSRKMQCDKRCQMAILSAMGRCGSTQRPSARPLANFLQCMVRAADMHQRNVVWHTSIATLEPPGVTSKEQPNTQATAKRLPCSCGDLHWAQ